MPVDVWRLTATGRDEEARAKLLRVWSGYLDEVACLQEGKVAVRLFHRLGFATDAPDEWAALPDPVTVYRAGGEGVAWTTDPEIASSLAARASSSVG